MRIAVGTEPDPPEFMNNGLLLQVARPLRGRARPRVTLFDVLNNPASGWWID